MKINKSIECPGFFWLPQTPDKKISGILHISQYGDAELHTSSLLCASRNSTSGPQLGEIRSHENVRTHNRILGKIKIENSSKSVTLENCIYTKRPQIYSEITTSTIVVNTVYLGAHYDEDEEIKFSEVVFSVEGLDEWLGISAIRRETNLGDNYTRRTETIHYDSPRLVTNFLLPSEEYELEFRVQIHTDFDHSLTKTEFSQKAYIFLRSNKLLPLKHFQSSVIKIQNFLVFAIDNCVMLNFYEGFREEIAQKKEVCESPPLPVKIIQKSAPRSKSFSKRSGNQMLLPCKS